jgi:microcompartment protein CcmK/EutM
MIFVTCWFRYSGQTRLLNQRIILEQMILGKVVGTIVTTISHKDYKNRRLLVVQPLILDGDQPEANEDFIALDNTQAGIGDTVLVNREGNGARQALKNPEAAVISVIVGIVDSVYLEI